MDIVLMIVYATLILGFLVFIHEGGHYLAARAFGVRVTEFMLGLPGPNIGFTKWGTKFGVTPFLLGGYAKVCGMEPGEMSPHLEPVLAALYRRGTANMEDIARDCGITDDEAYEALDELVEWGSIAGPTKQDKYNTYRAPVVKPSKKQVAAGAVAYELGQARPVEDAHALFESEYKQQYRSLPFWKRSVILVAGVVVNLLFAVLLFVVLFSLIGVEFRPARATSGTSTSTRSMRSGWASCTSAWWCSLSRGCSIRGRRARSCRTRRRSSGSPPCRSRRSIWGWRAPSRSWLPSRCRSAL